MTKLETYNQKVKSGTICVISIVRKVVDKSDSIIPPIFTPILKESSDAQRVSRQTTTDM